MSDQITWHNIIPLLKELGKPRFHGNGFVQLYLMPDIRLHIWHPDLPPIRNHNAAIHNHRYDMKSTIYAGTLTHTIYDVDVFHPHPDIRVIQLEGASGDFKKPKIETSDVGKLIIRHVYNFAKGSTYTMRRPYFHSSDNKTNKPIVTIFERSNKSTAFAKILCGINDGATTHAFAQETQPDENALWSIISTSLSYANPQFYERINKLFVKKGSDDGEN